MIRLLGPGDETAALSFLDREHAVNLILISDIVEYGMENRGHIFQGDYYGAYDSEELRGVAALFNFGSLFLYVPGGDAAGEAAGEMAAHLAGLEKRPRYFFAREDRAGAFLEEMKKRGVEPVKQEKQECLVLARQGFKPRGGGNTRARFARPDDLEAIMELQRGFQMEYYRTSSELEEEFGRLAVERMAGDGIVLAEMEGEVAAKVETMVRTRRMGQIGGVYTLPGMRGRGLAGECMSLLCARLLDDYEAAVLNVAVSNQPARRLYYGLGFERAGDFRMAVFT